MQLRPIKRLGQHFLADPNTQRKIVGQLEAPPDAHVVEIGPGPGALTALLAQRSGRLTLVEVDERAVAGLRKEYPDADVIHRDILEVDYRELAQSGLVRHPDRLETRDPKPETLYVIGNLPYNITSQILFGLLEAGCIGQAVVTMQKEVAERLVARPRTKAYGILSVLTQLLAEPSICFHLSPNVFRPKPEVWSSTVRLDWPSSHTLPDDLSRDQLTRIVRTAFNQRRKTLRNSLRSVVEETGLAIPERWAGKRAEELEPAEYVDLTGFLVVSQA